MSLTHPGIPRGLPGEQQQGFTLIEMVIVVSISMMMIVSLAKAFAQWGNQKAADFHGGLVAQYNSAVASYVTNEPARLGNLSPPQAFPFGNHAGIAWLQAPPCDGATGAVAYLPCNFDPVNALGLDFNTAVAQNGQYIRATTNFGPAMDGGRVDYPMTGAVTAAARGYNGNYTANTERSNGFVRWEIDLPTGNILGIVDTAVLGQPFLRTDGSNQMTGALNMGGNHINNADNVNAAGTVHGASVDATNNVTAGNDVLAARNVGAGRDVNAGRNVNANAAGNGGNVQIMGTSITLSESIQASSYVGNGEPVDKPDCPPDKPVQRLFFALGMFTSNDTSDPVTAVRPSYADAGDQWRVSVKAYTLNNPGGIDAPLGTKALVSTTCGD